MKKFKPKEIEELKSAESWRDVFEVFDNNLERFDLPICFDPREELKELNLRKWRIGEIAQRFYARYFEKKENLIP